MTIQNLDVETAAVRRVIDDAQRLQNDTDGYLGLHTDDAVIVNFGGLRVRGKDVIEERMRSALASPLAHVVTTIEVEGVHFLRPDVAVVDATKHVSDERDEPHRPDRPLTERGSLTYVLVKDDGQWRIAVAQTTPVTG